MLTLDQLQAIMPRLPPKTAADYLQPLNAAMEEFGINTPDRQAAFLAQLAHESGQLRYMEEWDHKHYLAGCRECERQRASGMDKDSIGHAAGVQYENRRDLGNNQPGDGVRFKGRGSIQLTGRANYRAASLALGRTEARWVNLQHVSDRLLVEWTTLGLGNRFAFAPHASLKEIRDTLGPTALVAGPVLEVEPEMVLEPEVGFRVAGWFWATRRAGKGGNMTLNQLADLAWDSGRAPHPGARETMDEVAWTWFDMISRAINGGDNGKAQRRAYYLRAREVLT